MVTLINRFLIMMIYVVLAWWNFVVQGKYTRNRPIQSKSFQNPAVMHSITGLHFDSPRLFGPTLRSTSIHFPRAIPALFPFEMLSWLLSWLHRKTLFPKVPALCRMYLACEFIYKIRTKSTLSGIYRVVKSWISDVEMESNSNIIKNPGK